MQLMQVFHFSMGHVRKDSLEEKQANQLLKDIEENMNINWKKLRFRI